VQNEAKFASQGTLSLGVVVYRDKFTLLEKKGFWSGRGDRPGIEQKRKKSGEANSEKVPGWGGRPWGGEKKKKLQSSNRGGREKNARRQTMRDSPKLKASGWREQQGGGKQRNGKEGYTDFS